MSLNKPITALKSINPTGDYFKSLSLITGSKDS